MKRLAILGTNGIPATYGGFETLAEKLVSGLASRWETTVYCSGVPREKRTSEYLGARLLHVPIKANGWQSLPYDILTTWHAMTYADVLLMLGPGAGYGMPANAIAKRGLVVNHGGLNEWEREKFSWFQRQVLYWGSYISARTATRNIADNTILKDSLNKQFNADAEVIRYGGDHVERNITPTMELKRKHPFTNNKYHLSVARAQVDNNIHLLIDAYARMPQQHLVIVSNWKTSAYGRELFESRSNLPNVSLVPAIYDQTELDFVRSRASVYIHSHSRCGTAPSLVEAMFLGLPIICFNVPTNKETTSNKSLYFSDAESLIDIVTNTDSHAFTAIGENMQRIAQKNFRWDIICDQYHEILLEACRD